MASESELRVAQEWCAKARQLLGVMKGRRHGNRMDAALQQIEIDLRQAREAIAKLQDPGRQRTWQDRYDQLSDEFVKVSKLARKAAETGVNEMAQIASEQLDILRYEIKAAFYGQDPANEQSLREARERLDQHAIRYKERYEDQLKTADKQRKELLAQNRPKMADAYEQPVVDAIGRARQLADEARYSEAIGELAAAEQAWRDQLAKAKKQRTAGLDEARDKPVFDSQHRAALARLEAIAKLPGTQAEHQQLTLEVQRIADAAANGTRSYRDAFEALLVLQGRLGAAEQTSERFQQQADQTVGGRLARARQALETFRARVGLAQPDAVRQHEQQIDAALRLLDAPQPDVPGASQALQNAADSLALGTQQADVAKDRYDQEVAAVTQQLERLRGQSKLEDYQGLLARHRQATAQYAAQQYAGAASTLLELKTAVERLDDVVAPQLQAWNLAHDEVGQGYLAHLERAAGLQLVQLQGAGMLLARFVSARDHLAGVQHDYVAAKAVAEEVKLQVGGDDDSGWRKALKDLDDLQGLRDQASQATSPVQRQVDALRQQGGDAQPFQDRLVRLVRDWQAATTRTVDRGVLDPALQTLEQGMQVLFDEVDAILQDPQLLGQSKDTAAAAQREAAFVQHKATVDRWLKRLTREYPGDAGPYEQRLGQAVTDKDVQPQRALSALQQLAVDLEGQLERKEREVAQLRARVQQVGQRYLQQAQDQQGQQAELRKAWDPLIHEIQGLLGQADSSVLAVVQEAQRQLDGYQPTFTQRSQALARIPEKIEALKQLLGTGELKQRLPQRHALLEARLKQEIPGRCADAPDTALGTVLATFEGEVQAGLLAASMVAQTLRRIATLADRLDQEAAQLADAPQLRDSLKARIRAARTPAEDGAAAAELELQQLEQTIAAVKADPELAAGLEQGVQQRAYEDEQARRAYEAQVELFELNEKKAASAQHSRLAEMLGLSTRNEQLWTQMENAFDEAQKLAKAGDLLRAQDRLTQARRLAREYAANPDSAKVTANKQLTQVRARWRGAAAAFLREMNTLAGVVRNQCSQDPAYQAQADALVQPLQSLAVAFDAGAFDAAVDKIQAAGSDLGVRRAAKEDGLRRLRRFQELLSGDPVLQLLADNPFAAVSTKGLKDAARDLEVNLLRA